MRSDELWDPIDKLIEDDGDSCSICHKPFENMCKTFYGKVNKKPAVVGDCCRKKIKVHGSGIYLKAIGGIGPRYH